MQFFRGFTCYMKSDIPHDTVTTRVLFSGTGQSFCPSGGQDHHHHHTAADEKGEII